MYFDTIVAMSSTSRITIPVDENFRSQLALKASSLGFDSIQAMFRYVGRALVDGRRVDFGEVEDSWGSPPQHVVERWKQNAVEHERDNARGVVKSFTSSDDALEYLNSL